MATKTERMREACEHRQRETGGKCLEECICIGWCSEVYSSVASSRAGKAREDRGREVPSGRYRG